MGLGMLLGKLSTGNAPPYWSAIATFLLGPLAVSLFGGFLGSRFAGRRARSAKSEAQ